ncbi:hypothetical protein [Methylobacterium oryzae]|uniref:DUF2946 domain-containing protein n=1 Tax=Methylobacterium oryzae TaxID=334852 RepID=A0ABU7TS20_9HYPH
MTFGVRHRRPAGARGWWALVARTLALVLTLAVAAPGAGLAADLAFHAGGHHDRSQGPALDAPAAPAAADPGLSEHLHCGCHQAARLEATEFAPPAAPGRLLPGALAQVHPSVSPDRLPRPPRA